MTEKKRENNCKYFALFYNFYQSCFEHLFLQFTNLILRMLVSKFLFFK